MRKIIVAIFCCFSMTVFAETFTVRSASELNALQLKPGDKVIMKDGEWKDQKIVFNGKGSEKQPIILTTEKPGTTKLTGNSNLIIDGTWLIVDGLYFTDGYSLKDDVILFTKNCSDCRITNSAVVNYNHPDKKFDYKWLSLNGDHNRVDHCWLEGKAHQGTTLVVWLAEKPNYHRIDHNYFGERPELGVNGGETIRIGTSTWSFHDSYTTVENNIFDHCDGELEIISNKSCKNTMRNNLFFESKGTLTFRHGNGSEAYGNIFIGNNIANTGGIRVIGEDQKVHDNYLQDITGTSVSAAISIMDGLPNPELTSHWQVKNASIFHNVIINSKESLNVGAGKNPDRYLKAENTSFTDNFISTPFKAIQWSDDSVHLAFKNNVVAAAQDAVQLPEGFISSKQSLKKDINGFYKIEGQKPADVFWQRDKPGPAWKPLRTDYLPKH